MPLAILFLAGAFRLQGREWGEQGRMLDSRQQASRSISAGKDRDQQLQDTETGSGARKLLNVSNTW